MMAKRIPIGALVRSMLTRRLGRTVKGSRKERLPGCIAVLFDGDPAEKWVLCPIARLECLARNYDTGKGCQEE
jgi:hypothetical protein